MNKRLQSVAHPPPVIGQTAPEELLADMRLTSLQSAAQLSLPPRRIRAHFDGAADTVRDGLHWEGVQAEPDRRSLRPSEVSAEFLPTAAFVRCSASAMARDLFPWGFFRKPLYIQVSFWEIPLHSVAKSNWESTPTPSVQPVSLHTRRQKRWCAWSL